MPDCGRGRSCFPFNHFNHLRREKMTMDSMPCAIASCGRPAEWQHLTARDGAPRTLCADHALEAAGHLSGWSKMRIDQSAEAVAHLVEGSIDFGLLLLDRDGIVTYWSTG